MKINLPVKFIAIDGHGGSGKSTFANMLSKEIGAEVIHVDDFTGADSTDDWYKNITNQVFEPVKLGAKTLTYMPAKWWQQHEPRLVTDQRITPVMILEGVGSLRKELAPFISLGIFIDTSREICLERGLVRDRGLDGKSDKQIIDQWNIWLDADDKYFARHNPKKSAEYVIEGTKPFEGAVSKILRELNFNEGNQ